MNAPGLRFAAVLFVVVVAGQRLVRLGWRSLVLRGRSYRLSNQRLLIESGVFSRTIEEIDLRTVDDITFHQRFFERMLGLARIGIVASEPGGDGGGIAGRARTVVELVGITDPRSVREQIRNAAYDQRLATEVVGGPTDDPEQFVTPIIKQKRFTGRTLGTVYALVSLGSTVVSVYGR